jgi:hypothetical protein
MFQNTPVTKIFASRTVVPRVCSVDPRGIRGYISVKATLKFTYLFSYRNNVLLKIIVGLLQLAMCLFHGTLRIFN